MKRILITLGLLVIPMMVAAAPPVRIDGGDKATPQADVTVATTATLVAAANANRRSLNCTNTSTSIHVRWGDANTDTTTGQRIPAGASVEILSIGAVYMAAESSTVAVSCTEETE